MVQVGIFKQLKVTIPTFNVYNKVGIRLATHDADGPNGQRILL
jgi:hypothetical protein